MARQFRPGKYRALIPLEIESAAKVYQMIEGREVPATAQIGKKVRKSTRKMQIGDFIDNLVGEATRDVVLNAKWRAWAEEQMKRTVEAREKVDAVIRSGAFRKAPEERRKPGRVAGKKYENYAPAMAKLAKERKDMTAAGIKWRKNSNRSRKNGG